MFLALALSAGAKKTTKATTEAPRPGVERTLADAPAAAGMPDSMALALATTWAEYLRPSLTKTYGDSNTVALRTYMEGVNAAFTTNPSREPYYRGVLEGMQLALRLAQLRQMGIDVTLTDFNNYLLECLLAGKSPMTNEQANNIINNAVAAATAVPPFSIEEEQRYLEAQFKREGVIKMENGLLIEVLREGEGKYPTLADKVVVSYTGRLSDGTVFDSSVERGEPATFGVTQVIPGWVEALQMMKVGAKWRLFIPSNLAYGPNGAGGLIGPNSTLIFDVELLKIN